MGRALGLHETEEMAPDLCQSSVAASAEEIGKAFHACDEMTDRSDAMFFVLKPHSPSFSPSTSSSFATA